MNTPTYHEQRNKIIDAYFKNEIKPLDNNFCFCGTLSPDGRWRAQYEKNVIYPYAVSEYLLMEQALFDGLNEVLGVDVSIEDDLDDAEAKLRHPKFEDALFQGMQNALEVLKNIHKSRGENVDDVPVFTKRKLQNA